MHRFNVRWLRLFLLGFALVHVSFAFAGDTDPTHDHDANVPEAHAAEAPPLGFSLTEAWLDPWPHSDLSRRGTPFVHLFNLEPAFLDRDLILSYRFTDAEEDREAELEAEVEWALTRRIGVLVEAPYVMLNPDSGSTESGVGDTVIGGRFLLAEFERVLLSANVGLSFPTGDASRGLGSGEAVAQPSFSVWMDLGHWFTFNAQAGVDCGLESGDDSFFYNTALTWSFRGPSLLSRDDHGHADHRHFPAGMTSLILELGGTVALDGEDDGRATQELLMGASYNVTEAWEVRAGYQIPLGQPRDFDSGYIISLLRHF